jgi:hypothetical protein
VIIRQIPHPEPLFHHLFDPLAGYLFTASLEWGNEHSWAQVPWRYPDELCIGYHDFDPEEGVEVELFVALPCRISQGEGKS